VCCVVGAARAMHVRCVWAPASCCAWGGGGLCAVSTTIPIPIPIPTHYVFALLLGLVSPVFP